MQAFDYAAPTTVDEAIALLTEKNGNARVLSGGTDLITQLKEGRRALELVVDVKRIPELTTMQVDSKQGLTLGAAVACHRMYNSAEVSAAYPGLMDSATLIGGTQIQGRASFGGNLCNSSPAADSIPNMIVHGAVATIAGPKGRRTVPVESFCTGPGQNVLKNGEFLVSLHFPAPTAGFGAAYLRFIPRNEMDIAVVGVGASVQLDQSGQTILSARIALGAVAPTPLFVEEAGAALAGKAISDAVIEEAAQIAQAAARPISDMRGSVEQRKHLSAVLTRRALHKAIERAKANQ